LLWRAYLLYWTGPEASSARALNLGAGSRVGGVWRWFGARGGLKGWVWIGTCCGGRGRGGGISSRGRPLLGRLGWVEWGRDLGEARSRRVGARVRDPNMALKGTWEPDNGGQWGKRRVWGER
jgi:hypothetical protein